MLKLPQILGWRPPVRGRHERPAAETPSVRPEEAGEAAVLPEDLEETLEADLLQDSEETPEQVPEETPAEPEAPAAGGEPGQADFLAGRRRPWRPCSGPGTRATGRPSTSAAGSTSSGFRPRAGRSWP